MRMYVIPAHQNPFFLRIDKRVVLTSTVPFVMLNEVKHLNARICCYRGRRLL